MSGVLSAVLRDWAVPKMNARVVKASVLVGNEASVGVFRKCGFVLEQTLEKATGEFPESKGGGKRDLYVLRWERE